VHCVHASFSDFVRVNFCPIVYFLPFEMHFSVAGELIVVGIVVFL
jgi:hypothetical protein